MSQNDTAFTLQLLSDKIREARKSLQLSQIDLAQLVGVSDKAISAYEVGRAVPPIDILQRISEVTRRPLSYFFNEGDEKNSVVLEKVEEMIRELESIKKLIQ